MTRATDTSRVTVEVSKVGEGSAPSRKHVNSLDGVRGIAILLVLMMHVQVVNALPTDSVIMHRIGVVMRLGQSGVDLFFALSGFLITGILIDTRSAGNRALSFYGRRILRIFPLYYFALALAIIGSYILRDHHFMQEAAPSTAGWISYLFYFQNWWMPFRENGHWLLTHFWSLGVEEQFYLAWPACVWLMSSRNLARICGFGCIMAFVLRCFLAHELDPSSNVLYQNLFTRMDCLLSGAFCAIAVRDAAMLRHARRWAPIVIVIAVIAMVPLYFRTHGRGAFYFVTIGYSLFAAGYGALVLMAYVYRGEAHLLGRILSVRPLVAFGKYSYGIYVYHVPIFVGTYILLQRYPWYGHWLLHSIAVCCGMIAISFTVAFASFHLFEKRFLQFKRHFKPETGSAKREILEQGQTLDAPSNVVG